MAIAGICSVARGCFPPLWPARSRCSPACSRNSAYPNAFAPTTVCPSQPIPWRDCLHSQRGGSVWGSCLNSLNRGHPNKMGGTKECIAPSKPKPLDPQQPMRVPNSVDSTTSAKSSTINDPTRRWTCKHPLPFTIAHPERCLINYLLSNTQTALSSAMLATMAVFGGITVGQCFHYRRRIRRPRTDR